MNACAGLPPERDDRLEALRRHPSRRLRPGRAPRGDGPRRRRRRGAVPHAAARRRRCSPTTDVDFHLALVRAYNDWLSEYVALRARPLRRPRAAPEPRCRRRGRRDRSACRTVPAIRGVVMGCYPNGTLECRADEDDAVFGSPRRGRHPADDPRVAHAGDAVRAPFAAARLRPLLRRAEPHRAADLRRRLRPVPGLCRSWSPRSTAAGCRTSRSRSTTTTSASTRSATSRSTSYRARTWSATCTSRSSPTRSAIAQPPRRRRRAHALVERLPAHQRRLAVLVAVDPGRDVGRAARRARADARRQRACASTGSFRDPTCVSCGRHVC